jgi:hypothetical protein
MQPTSADRDALARERDALRIQVAAVAAQQVACLEEETRLKRRQLAFERQEQQLAAHLEEERTQLDTVQSETRAARAALRAEQTAWQTQREQLLRGLEQAKHEAAFAEQQAHEERDRLKQLQRRFKVRWRRHWSVERTTLQQRQAEVVAERAGLVDLQEELRRERALLDATRLEANGDIELGRRQLQAERDRLHVEREQHAAAQTQFAIAHADAEQALHARMDDVAQAERILGAEKRQWAAEKADREQELESLEARIVSRRQLLQESNSGALPAAPATRAETPASQPPVLLLASCLSADEEAELFRLEQLAEDLGDQRSQLNELLCRWLLHYQEWQREQRNAADELVALAERLREREAALDERERLRVVDEEHIQGTRQAHVDERRSLEAWHSRLAAQEAGWRVEREGLVAEQQGREAFLSRQRSALDNLRRHWTERRRLEVEQVREERQLLRNLRQEMAQARHEWLARCEALDRKQRELAELELALEQERLERLNQADDVIAAERQIDQLRRRIARLHAAVENNFTRQWHALQLEAGRLEESHEQLAGQEQEHRERAAALATLQAVVEHECTLAQAAQAEITQELHATQTRLALSSQEARTLQEEVERLARLLLEEETPGHAALPRAA